MIYDKDALVIAQNLQNTEQYGDYLRSQADFLQSLTETMEAVHSSEDPERVQYDFEFFFGNNPPDLPDSVTDYCGPDLEQANLTLAKEASEIPTASVELHFNDAKNRRKPTFYISRDPASLDATDSDSIIFAGKNGVPQDVERVTRGDLNAIVLGFITGRQTIHAAKLEEVDVFSAESHEVLLDALQRSAASWQTHLHYRLSHNRDLRWSISGSSAGETLLACQFMYEANDSNGRKIIVDIDPQMGLILAFRTVDKHGDSQKLSTETGDLMKLQEVISDIRDSYDTTEVILTDPTALGQIAIDQPPELG